MKPLSMRYCKFYIPLLGVLCSLTSYSLSAQKTTSVRTPRADTLHRELLVVSNQEVQIEQAQPLNSKFEFDKPKLTRLKPVPPRATGDFTPPVVIPRHPLLSSLAAEVPSSEQHGYVQLSVGGDPNLRLLGGYNRLLGEKHLFDAHLSHQSTQHNTPTMQDRESEVKRHLSDLWVGYSHLGTKGTFSAQLEGSYDYYNYFAPNPLIPQPNPLFTSPLNVGEDYEKILLGYQTNPSTKIDASVALSYEHTGLGIRNDGSSPHRVEEQRFAFQTRIQGKRNNELRIGVALSGLAQISSAQQTLSFQKGTGWEHNLFLSEFVPHVQINTLLGSVRWDLYSGVGIGFLTTREMALYLYPKISTDFTFSRHVQLFARAEGGAEALSKKEWGQINRFINPYQVLSPNVYTLDSEVGIRTYWGYGISFNLSGGYQIAPNKTLLAPNIDPLNPSSASFVSFIPIYDKVSNWFLKGSFAYTMGEKLQVFLSALHRNYKLDQHSIAEGLPTWSVESEAFYRPTERLSFALKARLHFGIRYSLEPDKTYRMQEFVLRSNYRLNKNWSLHGEIKNPFIGSSEYPFGYRDFYPIAGMVGATLLF